MTGADVSRRGFIAGATAFAASTGRALPPAAMPLLRLGMISDVHLNTHETGMGFHNCLGYEPALRYFDERKADGVLVCGDLSDFGTAVGLRRVAAIWRKVFPGNRRSDGGSAGQQKTCAGNRADADREDLRQRRNHASG